MEANARPGPVENFNPVGFPATMADNEADIQRALEDGELEIISVEIAIDSGITASEW